MVTISTSGPRLEARRCATVLACRQLMQGTVAEYRQPWIGRGHRSSSGRSEHGTAGARVALRCLRGAAGRQAGRTVYTARQLTCPMIQRRAGRAGRDPPAAAPEPAPAAGPEAGPQSNPGSANQRQGGSAGEADGSPDPQLATSLGEGPAASPRPAAASRRWPAFLPPWLAAMLLLPGARTDPSLAVVPWGLGKVAQVMGLALLAQLLLGSLVLPACMSLAGLGASGSAAVGSASAVTGSAAASGYRTTALIHLALDMAQCAATLAILARCTAAGQAGEGQPQAAAAAAAVPAGLSGAGNVPGRALLPAASSPLGFRFPARLPTSWSAGLWLLALALLAATCFPLIDAAANESLKWFPPSALVGLEAGAAGGEGLASGGSALEASLSLGDWVTCCAYWLVLSVCAPLWEEALFRGFLLSSLAKLLHPALAVAASSAVFAVAHWRLATALPLLLLGTLFGTLFLASGRNLLTTILLHSGWNVYVLLKMQPWGA